ncbi:MAG TPA: magnesium-protoporphyrin IX monomethyl ester (oxidative) cyclase [Chloroflexia bacterium]|nr:magnesium-protoporphyrin IX monomethyl ester (oxidative) cyclase [Chloroflexia bacterium]
MEQKITVKRTGTAGQGAADSGSGPTRQVYTNRVEKPSEATVSALKEDILAPRFYTTNFKKLDSMNLESHRAEFDVILQEFRNDNNKGHFIPTAEFKAQFPSLPLLEFEEFLKRSCLGEFSGCLLYREISDKSTNPILKEAFKYITRDEGRHASFLTHTMRDLNIEFDLRFLTDRKKRYNIPPKIMFYTVYLSECIGYWRYITIYNQLEEHPEHRFHPIFKWFGRWCEDEHRHAHFFAILMRSQARQVLQGLLNHLLIRFFTLSVYITMFLRDAQPAAAKLYREMGLDPRQYDLDVIKKCDEEASTVWGFKFQVDNPTFVRQLDSMAANNRKLAALDGKSGILVKAQRAFLKARNIYSIGRLFTLKTIKTKA